MCGLVAEFELAENLRCAPARFRAPSALADITDLDVLTDCQAAKQAHRLKGPHHAGMGKAVTGKPRAIALADENAAGEWPLKTGKHIDQRGLARAVWTDEAEDLAPPQRHADVVYRDEAAETDGDATRLKLHIKRPARRPIVIAAVETSPPRSGR